MQAEGIKSLLSEVGEDYNICIHSDSSACRALTMRSGLGKCRHIDIKLLWIQEVSARAYVLIKPVGSQENVADLGTKFLEKARLERLRLEVHLEAQERKRLKST